MGKKLSLYFLFALFLLLPVGDASAALIAHWKFDNNGNDEVGDLTWTLNNGAAYSTDRKEGSHSLSCDGVDDYAGLTPPDGSATRAAFSTHTVLLWFKANSVAGTQVVFDEGGSTNGLAIRINNGLLETAAQNNHVIFTASTPFSSTDWTHVAASFDNGLLKLFLNGVEQGSVMADFDTVAAHSNVSGIGARNGQDAFDNTATGDYFGGLIDDVQIYSEALPRAEIEEIMAGHPKAWKPDPADGATDVTSPLFSWTPGRSAVLHDIYLGNSPDLGPDDLVAPRWLATVYWYGPGLQPGTIYYWKVDEISADGTVYAGNVWSFSVTPAEAWLPQPADGAVFMDPNLTLTWTKGIAGASHDVYLGTDEAAVTEGTSDTFKGNQFLTTFATGSLGLDTTYYWRIDEVDSTGSKVKGDVWSFTTLPEIPLIDDMLCWWKIDEGVGTRVVDWSGHGHHGEFVSEPARVEGYDGGALNFEGVDDSVIYRFEDETWSAYTLTVWARADVLMQVNNSAICSTYDSTAGGFQFSFDALNNYQYHTGIDQVMGPASLGWVHLAVSYDGTAATAYYDGDFVASFTPADADLTVNKFAIGVNRAEDHWFDGSIDDFRVYNRVLTQEEIELVMRIDPLRAWKPSPADGSIADARTASPLTWSKGDNAAKHDIYLGTDKGAVQSADADDTTGIYRGRINASSFTAPEGLAWGQEYLWRVDEVNADGSITTGPVWTFTVADYLIVDDFESYSNDLGQRVFETWIDGIGFTLPEPGHSGNGTGSAVGHDVWSIDSPYLDGTIMETSDVYAGVQAMPLYYDNTATPYYSRADCSWTSPQDWTFGDVNTLHVAFKGQPVAFVQVAPDAVTMSAAGTDIWDVADECRFAYKRLNGDGTIIARVDSIENTNVWAKGGVMIRETLDAGSRHAMVVVTPGSGVAFQRRLATGSTSTGTTEAGITAPHWVKLTRTGNELTAQHSADGQTWVDVGPDPAASTDTVVMGGTLYIGLALTSHSSGNPTTAEFSQIQTSGSVSGAWEVAEIGVDHPGNDAADLYVALEDSLGRTASVAYPNGAIVGEWTPWYMPLDAFTGVNLKAVTMLSIGIGNPAGATPDGRGQLLIDEIRLTRGVPAEPNDPSLVE